MTYPADRAVPANQTSLSESAEPKLAAPKSTEQSPRLSPLGFLANRAWSSAWTLLFLTNLFWAGNIVIGRAVAGHVPPVTLAYCAGPALSSSLSVLPGRI